MQRKTNPLVTLIVSGLAPMLAPDRADAGRNMAFDRSGNLFFAEPSSNKILKFAPDGTTTTFATGVEGPLAFDASGNLFVSAFDDAGTIFKFRPDGTRNVFESKLRRPEGLAFDAAGNLFVYDSEDPGKIVKLSPHGVVSTFAQKQKRPLARSVSPDGKWEFRPAADKQQTEGRGRFVIARVGSGETPFELPEELSGEAFGTFADYTKIVWAPDSKRFALNYQPGTRYQTTQLYQLNGDEWTELHWPESDDATTAQLDRSMAAQKKKLKLSPERRGRPIMTTRQV